MSKKEKISKEQQKINRIRNLMNDGRINRAIYECINFVALHPENTQGHYLFGKLMLRKNNLQIARREFSFVIEYQDAFEVKSRMYLAEISIAENDAGEAIRHYQTVIENSNYEDTYAINALAHLLRKEKRYSEALELLLKARKTTYEIEIERVKNLSLSGQIEKAYDALESLRPVDRDEEREKYLNYGRIAKASDDFSKAYFYFELAKEGMEEDVIYYKAILEEAKMFYEYEKYDESLEFLRLLEAKEYKFDGETYLLIAKNDQAQEQYELAYEYNQKCVAESKDKDIKSEALYNLGSIDFARGNLEDAEISFKRSISLARIFNEKSYIKLIGVLFREKKYTDALKYIARVKRIKPEAVKDGPLEYIELMIRKHQGEKMPPRDELSYAQRQIVEYKEKDMLEHVKHHHGYRGKQRGNFSEGADINIIYYFVKGKLREENMINEEAMDVYEVEYPHAGYDLENNLSHIIRVIVFPGTQNVLTMYPGSKATISKKGVFMSNGKQQQPVQMKK